MSVILLDALLVTLVLAAATVALAQLIMPIAATEPAEPLPTGQPPLYDWRALEEIDRRIPRLDLVWHDDWGSERGAR